jgi:hypothetical protein
LGKLSQPIQSRISWLFTYFLTNIESETFFYNIGFDGDSFMAVGIPTRFSKYFLESKFFIAIIFY